MDFAGEEEGWSCRQSMLQVGISRSEAIHGYNKDEILIAFPHGPHQHYYYCAAAPKRRIKVRLSKLFSFSILSPKYYFASL